MNEVVESQSDVNPQGNIVGTGLPEGKITDGDVVNFLRQSREAQNAKPSDSVEGVEAEGHIETEPELPLEADSEGAENVADSDDDVEQNEAETHDPEIVDLTDDFELDVKVNGELKQVSLADLKENYSGRSELSRQYQKMRDEQILVSEQNKQVNSDRENYVQLISNANAMMEKLKGSPPDRALIEDDPAEYQRRQLYYSDRVEAIKQMNEEIARVNDEQKQNTQKILNDYGQAEHVKLVQMLPDWERKDQDGKFPVREAILNYALKNGATEDQIRGVHPAWFYKAIFEASQYNAIDGKKQVIKKRSKKLPKVRAPGTRTSTAEQSEIKNTKAFLKSNKGNMRQREAAAVRLIRNSRK